MANASAKVPYLASPGSVTRCLDAIQRASTPDRVTQDFVKTKLGIKGGTGNALVAFLKKIGFVKGDGTPSDIYRKFRNPAKRGGALRDAALHGYEALYEYNEYAHELDESDLKGLLVQITGQAEDSKIIGLMSSTFRNLIADAEFDEAEDVDEADDESGVLPPPPGSTELRQHSGKVGMNLSYTINLNLPATTDGAVFNAIFRSLRENLLRGDNA